MERKRNFLQHLFSGYLLVPEQTSQVQERHGGAEEGCGENLAGSCGRRNSEHWQCSEAAHSHAHSRQPPPLFPQLWPLPRPQPAPSSAMPGPSPPPSLPGIPSQITNSFALRVLSANKSQSGLGFRLSGQLGELEHISRWKDGEETLLCSLWEMSSKLIRSFSPVKTIFESRLHCFNLCWSSTWISINVLLVRLSILYHGVNSH